ncbi:TRAFs-binding domain-containing protein [Guptibacillus spartinae]|uniref:TRAFs-binding domain-containing protein n=1 Tax=Guptibacillus spartinae TaxID=3025679 RepID=UPI00235F123E|nr:TRAFs-binding domain-containing protein [Pseudalkalibacillus spartinae]
MDPLLFVAMPFGKKKDNKRAIEIDFDQIYEEVIKPVAESENVNIIRADEERMGGIIHLPMFERLLLAEIVIADLTIPNPNVFYELGVRHCAKPRSTILIFSDDTQLPFDLIPIRGLPYHLKEGRLDEDKKEDFVKKLKDLIKDAKEDLEAKDSPLFQLIAEFPGIDLPHDVTESFRDRVEKIGDLQHEMKLIRSYENKKKAITELFEIEESLGEINSAPLEVVIDLLLSYRDVNAYTKMIELYRKIPREVKNSSSTLREQYAFALNRRNSEGDRQEAIHIIEGVMKQFGPSPESCGILGRIYKDRYEENKESNREVAKAYLTKAIEVYYEGFKADPRDFYPGINAVTLAYLNDDHEKVKELISAVAFAVTRRGGLNSNNYWEVATVLELAVLNKDWEFANRALQKSIILEAPSWSYETTFRNLDKIRGKKKELGDDLKEVEHILETLKSLF